MSLFDKSKCLAFGNKAHPQPLTSKSTHEATGLPVACDSGEGDMTYFGPIILD